MTHQQDNGRHYAYCACGVVGPLRWTRGAAIRDDRAHRSVCTSRSRS